VTRRLASILLVGAVGLTSAGAVLAGPAVAQDGDGAAQPGQRLPTQGPEQAEPAAKETVPLNLVGGLIEGAPIFNGDFADPYMLATTEGLFAFATNTTSANIPVVELPKGNTSDGEYLGDALPDLPAWTVKGFQWAPSVWARPDGRFVMHYTTPAPSPGFAQPRRQCISRAVADAPGGPYVDDSTGPFICPLEQGGAIDPSIFMDGDTPYLLWKSDGDCCKLPTVIYSQQLAPDGLTTAGPPNRLITADQAWEAGIVEGPSMVKVDDPPEGSTTGSTYDLFYSANNWNSADYAVGIAECTSVAGPCTKTLTGPWMRSAQQYSGPGGQEFFQNPGGVWMVHHGFLPGQAGTPDGQRRIYLDLLDFKGNDPVPGRSGEQEAEGQLLRIGAIALGALAVVALGVVLVVRRLRRTRRRTGSDDAPPPAVREPVS
jgi:hypothetical protein